MGGNWLDVGVGWDWPCDSYLVRTFPKCVMTPLLCHIASRST